MEGPKSVFDSKAYWNTVYMKLPKLAVGLIRSYSLDNLFCFALWYWIIFTDLRHLFMKFFYRWIPSHWKGFMQTELNKRWQPCPNISGSKSIHSKKKKIISAASQVQTSGESSTFSVKSHQMLLLQDTKSDVLTKEKRTHYSSLLSRVIYFHRLGWERGTDNSGISPDFSKDLGGSLLDYKILQISLFLAPWRWH